MLDCQSVLFSLQKVEIFVCVSVHAAVWVLCQSFVGFTVVSEVQMMFEDSSPQSRLSTNTGYIYYSVFLLFRIVDVFCTQEIKETFLHILL